jgi:serpin B
MRIGTAMAAVVAMAVAAAGCVSTTQGQASGPAPQMMRGVAAIEPAADPRPLAAADTAFGLDVLRAWCAQYPGKNLVFSPSTLASALGMAYLGARGATAQDMARVLHLPAGGDALAAELQARSAALGGLDGRGVTLAASSQVWADPALPPLRGYLNAVATGYGAGLAQAPFSTSPRRASDEINHAISEATHGHISHLVTPNMVSQVLWVLTSALYMNAAWATPFDPHGTIPGDFTLAAGHQVVAQFMSGDSFPYAAAGGWQAVSLPYKGGKLTMTALLPPSRSGACALPSQAALRTITAALHAGRATSTEVSLPKVNLSTGGAQSDMKPVLKRLGMSLAFSSAADFTALSPAACCIAFVRQAATLRVGEKGTVAAAAAAVGIDKTAARVAVNPVVFNRPYLMLVTDTATGEPLFLATVANPMAS